MKFGFLKDSTIKLKEQEDILLVDGSNISLDQILLAYHLTKKSMENKTNIAKKEKYEFLLWLSGKKDIKSAQNFLKPKEASNSLIFLFSNRDLPLEAKNLPKNSSSLDIEKISLSRI